MKDVAYMGIDPGANGAISIICNGKLITHSINDKLPREIWNCLIHYVEWCGAEGLGLPCVIEKQLPRPTRWFDRRIGKWQQSILRSTVILYGHYQQMVGMLVASGIQFEEALPQEWHKTMDLPKRDKGEPNSKWKSRLRDIAISSLSGIAEGCGSISVVVADSVLLALYCKRMVEDSREK